MHDEVIIDCPETCADLDRVCEIMGQAIPCAPGLQPRADGFTTYFLEKD